MHPHHERQKVQQAQPELPLRPKTDMLEALENSCRYIIDENGNTKIIIEKPTGTKTFDYPHSPSALIKAFQAAIVSQEEHATQLSVMILTCLAAYRSIAKEIKILSQPDKLEPCDNLTQQKRSAKDFIAKIDDLEKELEHDLKTNVKTLHNRGGSDYLEDITIMHDERRIEVASDFLAHLRNEIKLSEPKEKQDAAFQHFALRVEAVTVHLLDQGYENDLVVRELLACTKKIVEATQDPIAGAVYLQTNLHHFALSKTFGTQSTTDLLLSAQNIRHLNNDFLSAVFMAEEQVKPFIARLPLTSELLNQRRCFDYARSVTDALHKVAEQLDIKLEQIWKVFTMLETQDERKTFFDQIIQSPATFILYQLQHPNPQQVTQTFIGKHLSKKQFYLEHTPNKTILSNSANGNVSLVELVALAHQKLSPRFIKAHNLPENTFGNIIEVLSQHPSFLKIFNLLCNHTHKIEYVFDDLFASIRADEETRVQGYLTILEKSKDLPTLKKLAGKLKILKEIPLDSEKLLELLKQN